MFKNRYKSTSSLLLLFTLIFSLFFQPITALGQTTSSNIDSSHKLYETINQISINEIEIDSGTYLYGLEQDENSEFISIQYGKEKIEVEKDKLKIWDDTTTEPPIYQDYSTVYTTDVVITKNQSVIDGDSNITFLEETTYPVVEGERGIKKLYIGNVAYYLDENVLNPEISDENESSNEYQDSKVEEVEIEKEEVNDLKKNVRLNTKTESNDYKLVETQKTKVADWSTTLSKYFKVNEENLPVYDNRTGELVEVGQLTKDQVYPRVSDYGDNWHKIQYGDIYGYVYAPSTSPVDGGTLKNENTNYSSQERNFTALEDVVVYDNTSTELVPFGVINKGTEYPIVSDYGNWWRVLLSDRVGYVHKDAVQVNFKTSDKYFKVSTANLPVYDNRSGSLVKVGELKKGQVYPRISDYGPNWHKIQFGNIYGYVYANDTEGATGQALKNENKTYSNTERTFTPIEDITVYDNTSGKLVPFGELTKGTEYPIVSDYGNWWRVLLSDRVGYVHKDAVKRNFISEDRFFRVLTGDLSIYDNRSGELIEVGTLTKGQVYPRISDYGPNWHKIQFGNITGYVYSKDTESVSGNSLKNIANNYEVLQREITPLVNTPVYDNTSGKLVQFATLKEGKSYPKVKDYGNWWTVVVAGREGYVLKENVKHNFLPGDKFFKVTSKDLPVYDNRGSSLKKIGELRKDQTYPIVSDYGNWWRIQFGDIYGYVHKSGTEYGVKFSIENLNTEYSTTNSKKILTQTNVEVFDNSSGELVPFGELEEGIIYPIAFDYGNWWGIIYNGRVGFVNKNNVETGLNVIVPKLQVYESFSDLSIYTRQDEIATLYYGDSVQVIEEYKYAAKIQTETGLVGWIHKDKIDYSYDNKWYVKYDRNLRESASNNAKQIGYIESDTSIKVLDYVYLEDQAFEDWFKIKTDDNRIGWIWGGGIGTNLSQYETEFYNNTANRIGLFTPLNSKSTITAEQINRFIASKTGPESYMYGMGQAFLDAQAKTGLNAIYLVAHAAHETAYGNSSIVSNKYNYYGIGAFDACPSECANEFEGKRAGIINGAVWIKDHYVYDSVYKQFTIFNMRYNNNIHQYATDEAWDVKIVNIAQQLEDFVVINF
ncbi:SH3 domain-containing protein [Salirhabdus sp. Marseille-P4669]|uniref:SH3 domain-containing protein n=1 Tax=Salirhabdus sp. Marseille-P4669 TaxID=2042310 RepID=UPI000C7B4686|nr:SH3 domain-containing protein [Salirhabdus sp. Marseille-P4669]